jgi:hypothetical protein
MEASAHDPRSQAQDFRTVFPRYLILLRYTWTVQVNSRLPSRIQLALLIARRYRRRILYYSWQSRNTAPCYGLPDADCTARTEWLDSFRSDWQVVNN